MGVRTAIRRLLDRYPALLARVGLVDRSAATEAFDLAVKQSLLLSTAVAVPLTVVFWVDRRSRPSASGLDPEAVHTKAAVNAGRFWTGKWWAVAQRATV